MGEGDDAILALLECPKDADVRRVSEADECLVDLGPRRRFGDGPTDRHREQGGHAERRRVATEFHRGYPPLIRCGLEVGPVPGREYDVVHRVEESADVIWRAGDRGQSIRHAPQGRPNRVQRGVMIRSDARESYLDPTLEQVADTCR